MVIRRPHVAFLLLCFVVFASGCQSDLFIDVDVDDDGSGRVDVSLALDDEAAERTILQETVPVSDLEAAGWAVQDPERERGGITWLRASKEFENTDQMTDVIEEIGGDQGPFRNFRLRKSSEFAKTQWDFSGVVDLTGGLEAFTDTALTEALNGLPFGQSRDNIEAQIGAGLEESTSVLISLRLPGDVVSSNAIDGAETDEEESDADSAALERSTTTERVDDALLDRSGRLIWQPSFADEEPSELAAGTAKTLLIPRLWRWLAMAALVAAGLTFVYQMSQMFLGRMDDRRARARQRRREEGIPRQADPVPRPVTTPTGSSRAEAAGQGLRVVVLNQMGVLFESDDVLEKILIPFVREKGGRLDRDTITDRYIARTLGATSSAEFWAAMGITGDPAILDDALIRRFEVSDGVVDFILQARERGLSVVALANDAADWSARLRQLHELDPLVGPWVISAELGVRLPNRALLDALQRATGRFPENCMLIDTDARVLDIARELGFRTVQYLPNGAPATGGHRVLRSFNTVSA